MKRIILIILFSATHFLAQSIDSVSAELLSDSIYTILDDSLQVSDSLNISDSLKQKTKGELDAIVFTNAKDSLIFDVKAKEMYLYGEGNIKYKQTELKSGNIKINFQTSNLEAIGREDKSDSSNITILETPVLTEGSDAYEGSRIKYNFKTQKGFISLAKNSSDSKSYTGIKVKKVDKKIFFIEDGKFTTCDADTPHYYFGADRMKVMQGDKIIAKWIFMYIGGVPIPIPLPWGVFPNKTGRASGIIAPTYGNDGNLGWYLRNMGYFYVINDYADLTFNGDYYFKGGYGLRSRLRYNKRYSFNGNVNGGFSNRISNEVGDPDYSERFEWNINVNHHQKFTPTMQLDARLQFMSSDYLQYNSPNIADRVQQDIISNATLTKRWEGSGTNLTINYNRTQNLETGNITEDLPSLSLSKSREYPFRKKSGSSKDMSWYEYVGYDYSGKFRNNRKKEVIDSTTTEHTIHGGFDHRVNISASPKFGHFSLSPSLSLNSKWYNKRQVQGIDSFTDTSGTDNYYLDKYDIKQINTVNTYNFNLSASTKLYGMAQPQVLGVSAFRHTFEPRLTYSYRPDFSEDHWGYYDSYVDTSGNIIKYDKFGNQIFGGASSGKSQRLSISLGNIFEFKTIKDPTDTTSESHKIKLLDLGISSGYNFVADTLQFDDLSINFRTQMGKFLSLQGSTTLSPYQYFDGRQINQFVPANSGLLHLSSFNINLSSSLSGEQFISEEEKEKKKKAENEDDELLVNNEDEGDYLELYKDESPNFEIPWNLNLTYNYNFTDRGEDYKTKRSNLGFDLSFNLTQKWKLTFRGSYDLTNDKMNAPQVTIHRELHAWEAHMVWNPIGTYRGFKFEIRLKAPEFRDLKLSKSKDIYSGY